MKTKEEVARYAREYYQRRRVDPEYRKRRAEWARQWLQKFKTENPEEYKRRLRVKNQKRNRLQEALKSKFDITVAQYQEMQRKQNDLCAICLRSETATSPKGKIKRLGVDHDHATGKIRELLCSNCNAILGMANDNISILESAITYLKRHSNTENG